MRKEKINERIFSGRRSRHRRARFVHRWIQCNYAKLMERYAAFRMTNTSKCFEDSTEKADQNKLIIRLGRLPPRFSARRANILTSGFSDIPQFLPEISRIMP